MNINKILKLIRLAKTKYQNKFSLSYEDIDLIPDELFTLSTIQHLDLSINDIKYIPKDISKLKNLITIDLSSNKIEFSSCFSFRMSFFLNILGVSTVIDIYSLSDRD